MKNNHPIETVAGIVLAAGMSRRFGRSKQLVRIGSEFLLERVLRIALGSKLDRIFLVMGYDRDTISKKLGSSLDHQKMTTVINANYKNGMGSSIVEGVLAAESDHDAVMILLGDQPNVSVALIDELLKSFRLSPKPICAPRYNGIQRNPVIFGREMYARLLSIRGDQGARKIIAAQTDKVQYLEKRDPRFFQDIDTSGDLERLSLME